jgi:ATP-binding cassette subfamily B protein
MDETDCAAACLAMVSSHYHVKKSITFIREIAGTDTKGTNLFGLVKAAKELGFSAHALKGEKSALTKDLPFPFIAHIAYPDNGFTLVHYVVVKSIKKETIEIWDPNENKKKYKLSIEDFCNEWTGYAVFIAPDRNVELDKDNHSLLLKFLPVLKPYKSLLILACIASFLLVIFGILSTLYTRYVIDEVIFSQAKLTLASLSIGMLVIVILQGIINAVRNILLIHFSYKIDLNLVFSYFTYVFHLPLWFFDSRKTGEIISRMQDINKIRELLSEASVSIIMDTFMILVVAPFLFAISKTLFFIVLVTVPFSATILYIFSKLYKKQYRKLMVEAAEVESFLVESINGASTIKSMNAENYAKKGFEKRQMKMINTGWHASHLQTYQFLFTEIIKQIGNIVIFWVGCLAIIKAELSIGTLISFTALSSFFVDPLHRLVNLQSKLQESMIAADRLGEILELETEQNCEKEFLCLQELKGNILFSNIKFRYGTRKYLFDDLSLEIQSGQKIAIIGSSGCGKTTIAKLLLKLYTPESGKITIDNHDLLDIDSYSLRHLIGYVPQDINLFSGTIVENITLRHPDISFEEVVLSCQKAGADEFIEQMPDRYNTMIGEKGMNLSGGERQRIAMARALLGKPNILILDEATSNLDSVSEHLIKNTIDKLHDENLTIIIIAHRLSTIIDCDKIFVMDKGKIVQTGTHDTLKTQEGLYKKLLDGMVL